MAIIENISGKDTDTYKGKCVEINGKWYAKTDENGRELNSEGHVVGCCCHWCWNHGFSL